MEKPIKDVLITDFMKKPIKNGLIVLGSCVIAAGIFVIDGLRLLKAKGLYNQYDEAHRPKYSQVELELAQAITHVEIAKADACFKGNHRELRARLEILANNGELAGDSLDENPKVQALYSTFYENVDDCITYRDRNNGRYFEKNFEIQTTSENNSFVAGGVLVRR